MFKDPQFLTKISGGLLAGLWVVVIAAIASWVLYHPGEVEEPAYPLIAAEEAEAPAPTEPAATEAQPAKAPAPGGGGVLAMLASADAEAGAKVARKCSACHTFDKGGKAKVGPNLWDVVGRGIATAEGFRYSGALSGMGGEWTYEKLDGFLTAPKAFAAGTKMSFAGLKDDGDRANVIAFLRSLSDDPKPLP